VLKLFNEFYSLVKKEYWGIQKSLYGQYPWYKQLNKSNYILKFFMDLSTLFYETVQFLGLLWALILYLMVVDKIMGRRTPINVFATNSGDITGLLIGLIVIAVTCRIPYFIIISDYRKESRILEKVGSYIWGGIKSVTLKTIKSLYQLLRNIVIYIKKLLKKVENKSQDINNKEKKDKSA